MFTGVKSVIYPSSDLEADKKFWEGVTGVKPYFDQPYYVGFSIEGCELGLDPNAASQGSTYPISYWLVEDARAAIAEAEKAGATLNAGPRDVGEGILMATLKDLNGNIFGIIENHHA